MRCRSRAAARLVLAALALAMLQPGTAFAEGIAAAPDDSALILFPPVVQGEGEAAATFGSALQEALGRALAEASFSVTASKEALDPTGDQQAQASSLALAAGAGWAAIVSLELADKRIAYTLRVYDAREPALAAAAGFSAYAGVSSLPLFEDSSRTVAAKARAWRASMGRGGANAVRYKISVSSPDEGATVSLSSGGAAGLREIGTIADGSLLFPYIPFEIGTRIVISLSKQDRASLDIPIQLGAEAPAIAAPALRKPTRENLLLGTGPGRFLGLGATYRTYFLPDWNFLFFNERLFAGYDFSPGSKPVLHLETWEGLGSYLFFPPASAFRMGACVGWGFMLSFVSASAGSGNPVFLDVALIPIEAFFEYSIKKGPTVWLSFRGAYAVNSDGLLGRGWIGNGQPDLTAGIMWRR
jgi:hypothetical protein